MSMSDRSPSDQSPSDRYPFGAPIDRSQETYRPSPYPAQKTLPHGDVSPDGTRVWPEPSLTSRVLVYGGAAIAAAAVTAGAVLAVRKVADLVTGDDELHRDADRAAEGARERVYSAARRDGPTEREREAMRARARMRMQQDDSHGFGPRGDTAGPRRPDRPRPSRQGKSTMSFMAEIEDTTQRLTRNLNSIIAAVGGAMSAFRAVADNAEGVVRDFSNTADQIRGFLNTGAGTRPGQRRADPQPGGFQKPKKSDVVDLREDGPAAGDPRTHRL